MGRILLLLTLLISVNGLMIDIRNIETKSCDTHNLEVICKTNSTELSSKNLKIAQDGMTLAICQTNKECSLMNNETYHVMFDGMLAKLSVMAMQTKNDTIFSCGIDMNKAVMKLKIWGCAKPNIKWHEHPYVNLILICLVVILIIAIFILTFCICRLRKGLLCPCFSGKNSNPKKYNGKHHEVRTDYKQTDAEADVKHSDNVPRTEEAREACAKYDNKEEAAKLLKGYCEDRTGIEETME